MTTPEGRVRETIDRIDEPETSDWFQSTNLRLLWAKINPRHPLWKHLLDAAAVSLELPPPSTDGWGSSEMALLVGLHDIGKADSAFQHQIPDFRDELVEAGYSLTADVRCRHERISARFIKNKLAGLGLIAL